MKYAILSDIHGNLEALQAVLQDAKQQGCTHYVCLGDIVGYGPNPRECLHVIQELNCPTVIGNHDEYVAKDQALTGFNPMAADGIKWTRDQLTEAEKNWLRDLKYVRTVDPFTIVHATLDLPERWAYVFDKLAAAASFNYQHTAVCFNGHTHVPIAFIRTPAGIQGGLYTRIRIEVARKYFINVGSVGQPRDRNPKAAYVIFDLPNNLIELRRVEYDLTTTQKKIRAAGLPESLAQRLEQGR
ncbi:MAG: metallophosphatase family protein [Verrucomicrobiae bacterium]|nr:metallophosphatase family protein [Verrucomicrobiae bacterium]MDW8343825.1 metallophosphoesterase family protein [Verrucomicrobiae bacterium]